MKFRTGLVVSIAGPFVAAILTMMAIVFSIHLQTVNTISNQFNSQMRAIRQQSLQAATIIDSLVILNNFQTFSLLFSAQRRQLYKHLNNQVILNNMSNPFIVSRQDFYFNKSSQAYYNMYNEDLYYINNWQHPNLTLQDQLNADEKSILDFQRQSNWLSTVITQCTKNTLVSSNGSVFIDESGLFIRAPLSNSWALPNTSVGSTCPYPAGLYPFDARCRAYYLSAMNSTGFIYSQPANDINQGEHTFQCVKIANLNGSFNPVACYQFQSDTLSTYINNKNQNISEFRQTGIYPSTQTTMFDTESSYYQQQSPNFSIFDIQFGQNSSSEPEVVDFKSKLDENLMLQSQPGATPNNTALNNQIFSYTNNGTLMDSLVVPITIVSGLSIGSDSQVTQNLVNLLFSIVIEINDIRNPQILVMMSVLFCLLLSMICTQIVQWSNYVVGTILGPIDEILSVMAKYEDENFNEHLMALHDRKFNMQYESYTFVGALLHIVKNINNTDPFNIKQTDEEAILQLCRAHDFYRRLGNRHAVGVCSNNLGSLLAFNGYQDEAINSQMEAINISLEEVEQSRAEEGVLTRVKSIQQGSNRDDEGESRIRGEFNAKELVQDLSSIRDAHISQSGGKREEASSLSSPRESIVELGKNLERTEELHTHRNQGSFHSSSNSGAMTSPSNSGLLYSPSSSERTGLLHSPSQSRRVSLFTSPFNTKDIKPFRLPPIEERAQLSKSSIIEEKTQQFKSSIIGEKTQQSKSSLMEEKVLPPMLHNVPSAKNQMFNENPQISSEEIPLERNNEQQIHSPARSFLTDKSASSSKKVSFDLTSQLSSAINLNSAAKPTLLSKVFDASKSNQDFSFKNILQPSKEEKTTSNKQLGNQRSTRNSSEHEDSKTSISKDCDVEKFSNNSQSNKSENQDQSASLSQDKEEDLNENYAKIQRKSSYQESVTLENKRELGFNKKLINQVTQLEDSQSNKKENSMATNARFKRVHSFGRRRQNQCQESLSSNDDKQLSNMFESSYNPNSSFNHNPNSFTTTNRSDNRNMESDLSNTYSQNVQSNLFNTNNCYQDSNLKGTEDKLNPSDRMWKGTQNKQQCNSKILSTNKFSVQTPKEDQNRFHNKFSVQNPKENQNHYQKQPWKREVFDKRLIYNGVPRKTTRKSVRFNQQIQIQPDSGILSPQFDSSTVSAKQNINVQNVLQSNGPMQGKNPSQNEEMFTSSRKSILRNTQTTQYASTYAHIDVELPGPKSSLQKNETSSTDLQDKSPQRRLEQRRQNLAILMFWLYYHSGRKFDASALDIFQKIDAGQSSHPNIQTQAAFLAFYTFVLIEMDKLDVAREKLKKMEQIILQIEPDKHSERFKVMRQDPKYAPKSVLMAQQLSICATIHIKESKLQEAAHLLTLDIEKGFHYIPQYKQTSLLRLKSIFKSKNLPTLEIDNMLEAFEISELDIQLLIHTRHRPQQAEINYLTKFVCKLYKHILKDNDRLSVQLCGSKLQTISSSFYKKSNLKDSVLSQIRRSLENSSCKNVRFTDNVIDGLRIMRMGGSSEQIRGKKIKTNQNIASTVGQPFIPVPVPIAAQNSASRCRVQIIVNLNVPEVDSELMRGHLDTKDVKILHLFVGSENPGSRMEDRDHLQDQKEGFGGQGLNMYERSSELMAYVSQLREPECGTCYLFESL